MAQTTLTTESPCISGGTRILQSNDPGRTVEPFPLNHAGQFSSLMPSDAVAVMPRCGRKTSRARHTEGVAE